MIQLEPMTASIWSSIMETRIPEYAAEQVCAGRWSEDEALEQANEEFQRLLPHGVNTGDHHIYSLVEQSTAERVGYLWYMEREKAGSPTVFLCDVRVFEPHRRLGYGAAALQAFEQLVSERHGSTRIELHVFGSNHPARALYTKLGFEETNVMMAKTLQ